MTWNHAVPHHVSLIVAILKNINKRHSVFQVKEHKTYTKENYLEGCGYGSVTGHYLPTICEAPQEHVI